MKSIVVDIGNTSVKVAAFENQSLVSFNRLQEEKINLSKFCEDYDVPVIISPTGNLNKVDFTGFEKVLLFNNVTPLPIKLNYQTPETLGLDRIAAAVGAYSKNKNTLVIDFGTCVTYDLIDRHGVYQGGFILPGIDMRLKAMNDFTDKLPYVYDWRDNWKTINGIGKSTYECLLSGVKESMHMEIFQMIHLFEKEFADLRTIYTGGDADFFDKELKNSIFAMPKLVLDGLNKILLHNI